MFSSKRDVYFIFFQDFFTIFLKADILNKITKVMEIKEFKKSRSYFGDFYLNLAYLRNFENFIPRNILLILPLFEKLFLTLRHAFRNRAAKFIPIDLALRQNSFQI